MWSVVYENESGKSITVKFDDFPQANLLAKSLRQFSNKVRLKKTDQSKKKWDVLLFHDSNTSEVVASKLSTRAAMLTWIKWNHLGHASVIVLWPNEVPKPPTFLAVSSS